MSCLDGTFVMKQLPNEAYNITTMSFISQVHMMRTGKSTGLSKL